MGQVKCWRSDKARVVDWLCARNSSRQLCAQYADVWMTYREAQGNVDEHGALVFHPRTGSPVPNPYLRIRDDALRMLVKLKDEGVADTGDLWSADERISAPMGAGCGGGA